MNDTLIIRKTLPGDLADILTVEEKAFNSKEEAELVRQLLADPSAEPRLSLLAFVDDKPVGHIIFSRADFDPAIDVVGSILGPLAVVPEYQKMGVGGQMIGRGLEFLKEDGVDWVFVLGHESYYPRHGFTPAQEQGFEPPYSIPEEFTNAWMAQALTPNPTDTYHGKIIPAKTFDDPKYWGK
jgi:putative acetyltransferase